MARDDACASTGTIPLKCKLEELGSLQANSCSVPLTLEDAVMVDNRTAPQANSPFGPTDIPQMSPPLISPHETFVPLISGDAGNSSALLGNSSSRATRSTPTATHCISSYARSSADLHDDSERTKSLWQQSSGEWPRPMHCDGVDESSPPIRHLGGPDLVAPSRCAGSPFRSSSPSSSPHAASIASSSYTPLRSASTSAALAQTSTPSPDELLSCCAVSQSLDFSLMSHAAIS
mmetsp:Transcript_4148/g.11546  ORF Transcript_4148/g.11546 Transcript_4148/m.11546 type:complete len:233 (+) Transcript_4148:986-1684(+)